MSLLLLTNALVTYRQYSVEVTPCYIEVGLQYLYWAPWTSKIEVLSLATRSRYIGLIFLKVWS